MIEHAVKKPFLSLKEHCGFLDLATDIGNVDDEEYVLKICPAGPVFNHAAMQVQIYRFSNVLENLQ